MDIDEIVRRERAFIPPSAYHDLGELASQPAPGEGIKTGWSAIDKVIVGLQENCLNLVVGYTSHGKTAGMATIVVNNILADTGVFSVFASSDDSAKSLLYKFIGFHAGMSTQQVWNMAREKRREYAEEHLAPNLCIATNGDFSVESLQRIILQAQDNYGKEVNLFCFDYLGLLAETGDGSRVRQAATAFKKLVRDFPNTTFLLGHQCSRLAVRGSGVGLQLDHIDYGGEKEADGVIIGFRRRVETEDLSDEDLAHEQEVATTNISVMKNKVTGGRTTLEGVRHVFDPVSGMIREAWKNELIPHSVPASNGQANGHVVYKR